MAEKRGIDWRLIALVYGVIAAAFVARTVYFSATTPLLADTDDAMRLVAVRDFLAGQAWFDNLQHRLNTPFGAELHWSRLADLPLVLLLAAFRPVFGAAAETVAAYVLPLVLLFFALYLSGRITLKLVGREGLLAGLVLPAFSLSILGEFAPGRIDHHSLQILLLMTMLWCAIEAVTRPRFAVGAGLAAATSLAVGIEGLPGAGAAILAFGMLWVATPARAGTMRAFGLSLALGTIAHLALAVPPERWLVPACDAISLAYAAGAVAVGIAFVLLATLPLATASLWVRLALGILTGTAVAIGLGIAFPDCLRGPYAALDPWLVEHWLDRISEAEPLWQSFATDPVYPLAVAVPSLVAIVAIVVRLTRGPRDGRGEWLIYATFFVLAAATMLLQIRASRLATPLAVPACAAAIVAARHFYLERRSVARTALLVASWLASAGLAVGLIATLVVEAMPAAAAPAELEQIAERRRCLMPSAFTELAVMPPARLMNPIDLGSHILAFTPHEVVAAPYHRNVDGVRDAFAFFNGPVEMARDILDERGVTLVVVCPALPEMRGLPDAAPDSFVALYATDRLPAWLVETSLPGAPLRVYSVTPR